MMNTHQDEEDIIEKNDNEGIQLWIYENTYKFKVYIKNDEKIILIVVI
jgi:hypothetical protein